jgi:two-component system osmolarity sensor histidine kinase EnvZ
MTRLTLKRMLPQTLLGRSTLIVILPVLILQVVTVYIFFDRHWERVVQRLSFAVAGEIAIITQAIENADDPRQLVTKLTLDTQKYLDISLKYLDQAVMVPGHDRVPFLKQLVVDKLDQAMMDQVKKPFAIILLDPENRYLISVQLSNGVLQVEVMERRLYSSSSYIFLLWMIGISVLLTLISVVFLRNQIRPIRKLAVAAERFGRGLETDRVKPEGAREVRAATRAFIDMRERIGRQLEQRALMLAGVSHDMRTPLTRLKLGLGLLDQTQDTTDLKADVDLMERMLSAYLDFVAAGAEERAVVTDLTELVRTLVARLDPEGRVISVEASGSVYMTVRPLAMTRAIKNVVTNAMRYAKLVRVVVVDAPDQCCIVIADNGPGLEPDQYAQALKPFVRLDPGRGVTSEGGVGLGLSITQDIMRAHGGDVTLARSVDLGGLEVTLMIPR